MSDISSKPAPTAGLCGAARPLGLDGLAVKNLLGGAVLRGQDPHALLRAAGGFALPLPLAETSKALVGGSVSDIVCSVGG